MASIIRPLKTAILLITLSACSSDNKATHTDAGPDGSTTTVQAPGFQFVAPIPGEIVAPMDALDLRVVSEAAVAPTLLVNETPASVTWTQSATDPTLFTARYTIPSDAAATLSLAAAGPTPDFVADSIDLVVAQPKEVVTGSAGATETILTLPSTGAVLHVPAGAITGGGEVSFASYDVSVAPSLDGAQMLAPIYRVHSSADETHIVLPMTLEQPLSSSVISGFGPNDFAQLSVYEGPDPDVEAAPFTSRMSIEVKGDGSGVARSPIPPSAFHHTGSCATIVSLQDKKFPFGVTKATVEASNDADGNDDLQDLTTNPTVKLSNAGTSTQAHLNVVASVEWKDGMGAPTAPPANLRAPLDMMVITSPLGTMRWSTASGSCGGGCWRVHEGVDFRAQSPTPIYASAKGSLRLNMGSMDALNLWVNGQSKWVIDYLHISEVNGATRFSQQFAKNKPFGTNVGGHTAKAPLDGVYGLDCSEVNHKLMCSVTNDDNQTTLAGKGCSGDKSYCITKSQGIWMRDVALAEVIGKSGSTKTSDPHLHYEMMYGGPQGTGVPIDAALFFDAALKQGSGSGPVIPAGTSEMIRFAAQLDGPTNLLGVDPSSLASLIDLTKTPPTSTLKCPYDKTIAIDPTTGYSFVRMSGDNSGAPQPLTINWDLGPCVWTQVHKGTSVNIAVGPTFWRWGDKGVGQPKDTMTGWLYVDEYKDPPPTSVSNGIQQKTTSNTSLSATVQMCDGLADPANCPGAPPLTAKSFEGMQITVQGIQGEFATSTMTLTNVTAVASVAAWQGSHPNEAGTLSSTLPNNAQVYTFLDNAQPAGVKGFPSVFGASNFANRNGRSNLIAVWQDQSKKWQWVMNVSGGSYTTGGGFPQWHEYQFIYDSRSSANPHNRYDVYLGANAMGSGFTFNRTAKTSVSVAPIPKQLKPFQP